MPTGRVSSLPRTNRTRLVPPPYQPDASRPSPVPTGRAGVQVPPPAPGQDPAGARAAALARQAARFPGFFAAGGAAGAGLEAELGPGDAIFFPAYWFHYTETLDTSFSLGYRYFGLAD